MRSLELTKTDRRNSIFIEIKTLRPRTREQKRMKEKPNSPRQRNKINNFSVAFFSFYLHLPLRTCPSNRGCGWVLLRNNFVPRFRWWLSTLSVNSIYAVRNFWEHESAIECVYAYVARAMHTHVDQNCRWWQTQIHTIEQPQVVSEWRRTFKTSHFGSRKINNKIEIKVNFFDARVHRFAVRHHGDGASASSVCCSVFSSSSVACPTFTRAHNFLVILTLCVCQHQTGEALKALHDGTKRDGTRTCWTMTSRFGSLSFVRFFYTFRASAFLAIISRGMTRNNRCQMFAHTHTCWNETESGHNKSAAHVCHECFRFSRATHFYLLERFGWFLFFCSTFLQFRLKCYAVCTLTCVTFQCSRSREKERERKPSLLNGPNGKWFLPV